MLAIAMTLIAGAAAWGFVNSQAGASEGALQNNAVATNDMLSEHFAVVDMYFGTTTSTTFMLYNPGSLTYQTHSVRFYGSRGNVNLLFNYTQSGVVKTNYVYDLRSTLASKCKTATASYESPSPGYISGTTVKLSNSQFFTLTIPPTTSTARRSGTHGRWATPTP